MDEEQLLLDKLGRGDVDALDTLYVRYAPKVYDFSLRFLKNEAEAEDVTQDIFLQVWDNRSLMGQVVSIRAYLFRMTRNTIFNRFKRSKMHLQYIRQSETREAELSVDPGRRITTEDLLEMIELGTARRRSAGISLPVSRQMPYVLFSMRTKAACNPWMNFNWRWARRVVSSLDKVLAPSSSTLYVGDVSSVSLPSAPVRLAFNSS